MTLHLAERFLDNPVTFYMVSFVLSTIILSVLCFVPVVSSWIGVDIATLSLMAVAISAGDCICSSASNSMKVITASIISNVLTGIWTVTIKAVFTASSAEYNSYIAVVWALPLMIMHAFAYTVKPITEVYSVPIGALMVCTVPIYGSMANIYSELGRCMLASTAAGIVTFLVTLLLSLVRCRSCRLCGSSKMALIEADSALLSYFHALCTSLMSPSGAQEDYMSTRAASLRCQKALYRAWKQSDDEGAFKVAHLQSVCFGNLATFAQTIHPPRSGSPLSLPEACDGLVTAPFMIKFTAVIAAVSENSLPSEEQLVDLVQSSMGAHVSQAYKSAAADAFALQAAVLEIVRFVRALRRARMASTQYIASTMGSLKGVLSQLSINTAAKWKAVGAIRQWFSSRCDAEDALCYTVRMAAMMFVATILYTLWEGRDSAVDAYALWGLLPGLMTLQVLLKGGMIRAVYCVAPLFAWTLFGGILGLASAEANRGNISAYATQLVLLAALASYFHRRTVKKVSGPLLAYISWVVVAIASWKEDETRDSYAIWHVALYRIAIVCTGVFLAMIFAMVPPPFRLRFALDAFHKDLLETAVDVAMRAVVKATQCQHGDKAEGQSALAYSRSMSRLVTSSEEEKPQASSYKPPRNAASGVPPKAVDTLVHFPFATKPLLRQGKLQDKIMRRGKFSTDINEALVDLSWAALAVASPARDCRLGVKGVQVAGGLINKMDELLAAIKATELNVDLTSVQHSRSSGSWVRQAVIRLNTELTRTRTKLWAETGQSTNQVGEVNGAAEKFLLTGLLQVVSLAVHLVHFGDCWLRLEDILGIQGDLIGDDKDEAPFLHRGPTFADISRRSNEPSPFVPRSQSARLAPQA